jgi:hypothetical protein
MALMQLQLFDFCFTAFPLGSFPVCPAFPPSCLSREFIRRLLSVACPLFVLQVGQLFCNRHIYELIQ